MVLPTELIDLIFSFLSDDISALKACSKVRHSLFSKHAKRRLYKDIVIRKSDIRDLRKQISEDPSLLDYPRTLEIRTPITTSTQVHSIIQMIPRMPNLKSLTLQRTPYRDDQQEDFISMFGRCLQQSSINELFLSRFSDFPLSLLDNVKNIRKLTLDDCSAKKEVMPGSESDPTHRQPTLPLATLRISRYNAQDIRFWADRQITSLTWLELCAPKPNYDWTAIPVLLTACSSSLTTLHLDTRSHCQSEYSYNEDHHVDRWTDEDLEFPFTLSALARLKKLHISACMFSSSGEPNGFMIRWALPAIIRLIKTLPSVEELDFDFHCVVSESDLAHLARWDWSLFDSLQSDFPGIRPKICITCEAWFCSIPPERVIDALAENEALIDLVERDVVSVISKQIPDTLPMLIGGA